VPAHLDQDLARRPAVRHDAAVVANDLGDIEPAALRPLVERADGVFALEQEADVKALGVRGVVFAPLQDEHEPVPVVQDRDGRRGAARAQLEAEVLLEEERRALNVGDVKVEMIQFHGEPRAGHTRALRLAVGSRPAEKLRGGTRAPTVGVTGAHRTGLPFFS
jgi:hypothetical protein